MSAATSVLCSRESRLTFSMREGWMSMEVSNLAEVRSGNTGAHPRVNPVINRRGEAPKDAFELCRKRPRR